MMRMEAGQTHGGRDVTRVRARIILVGEWQMAVGITKRRFGGNLKWFHLNPFLFQDHWFRFRLMSTSCQP